MKLGKLKELVRAQLDDAKAPYLWSDIELLAYFNEAEREAAIRSRLLVDSSTAAVCEITVSTDTQNFSLDPRVIMVRRAKLDSDSYPLEFKQVSSLDEEFGGWDDVNGGGIPAGYFTTGLGTNIISIPKQDAATTLRMVVVREPLVEMNDDEESPEIASRYHINLIEWVKYRCYLKPDSETQDEKKAAANLALFENVFGPRRSALELQFEMEHEGYNGYNGAF